jgi:16S rRNA processing protein RimM
MARNADDWVVLGRIRGVFGVKGLLRVESYSDVTDSVLEYARWRVSTPGGYKFLCPLSGRWHGPGLVVQLGTEDGGVIADRESAAALVGASISVRASELPVLGKDEVYWADLVGLQVIGIDEEKLGSVAQVFENPAHPILQLATEPPLLIPFVRGAIVESVDLDTGIIRVLWSSDYAL